MTNNDIHIEKEKQLPLVSFVALTYNHADFVEDTLAGALSQDYPNLEIIISDDASPDGTYDILQNLVKKLDKKEQVILNHNVNNLGGIPHLNYVISNFVHGDIIVLAGGDDISMPHRVSETVCMLNSDDSIMAVSGQMLRIDKFGRQMQIQLSAIKQGKYSLDNEYIKTISFMCGGAGLAFRKIVWDTFGALKDICPTEDSTIRLRALMMGNLFVSPNTFIKYRIHDHNISRPENIYNLKTHGIVNQYSSDVQLAMELGLISNDFGKRLEKKILLYEKDRNLAACKVGKPRLIRGWYKIQQEIVQKIIKYI